MPDQTFTIPIVPISLNEYARLHWRDRDRARGEFQMVLRSAFNAGRLARGLQAVEIHSVIVFPTVRGRDSDNYGAVLAKWTQDVLVEIGVLPNDTADRCTSFPPKIVVGRRPTTFLEISEVDWNPEAPHRPTPSLEELIGETHKARERRGDGNG
jgi:hypothetical protein